MGNHTSPNLKDEFVCCGHAMMPGYVPGTYYCETCINRKKAPLEAIMEEIPKKQSEEMQIIEQKIYEQVSDVVDQIVEEMKEEPNTPPQNQLEDETLQNLYLGIPIPKQRSHHMTLRTQPRLNYNEYFGRPRKRRRKL